MAKNKFTISKKYRKQLEKRIKNQERHGIPRWKKEQQEEKDRKAELDRQQMNFKYQGQHDWTDNED